MPSGFSHSNHVLIIEDLNLQRLFHTLEFADSATDLSTVNGLESGEISTYDECVSAFKTSGYLINISEDGAKQYLWVNADDGYMTVTFKADGSVKTYNGYC